jgi:hypothetical protein
MPRSQIPPSRDERDESGDQLLDGAARPAFVSFHGVHRLDGDLSDAIRRLGNESESPMTPSLFHESLADALRECIAVCGGSKDVGRLLWPEKAPDVAGRLLADCLNDAKREKLSPEQVLLILRLARERGCHAGMTFIARELGYADPQPIEPEDERAKLQRDFIESTKALARMAQRIEQLERPTMVRAA